MITDDLSLPIRVCTLLRQARDAQAKDISVLMLARYRRRSAEYRLQTLTDPGARARLATEIARMRRLERMHCDLAKGTVQVRLECERMVSALRPRS